MRRDLSRATAHPMRPAVKVLAALGSATLFLLATGACTGSSTQTYAQLEKAARKVPVPPGVTFVDVTRTKMDPGSGITYEVDVSYSSPSMTCDQLRTAWIAALTQAHRGTHPVAPNDGQIFVKDSSFTVAIDLGSVDVHNCARPAVGASTTQPPKQHRVPTVDRVDMWSCYVRASHGKEDAEIAVITSVPPSYTETHGHSVYEYNAEPDALVTNVRVTVKD